MSLIGLELVVSGNVGLIIYVLSDAITLEIGLEICGGLSFHLDRHASFSDNKADIAVIISDRNGAVKDISSRKIDHRCTDSTMVEIMAVESAVEMIVANNWEHGIILGDNPDAIRALKDKEYYGDCIWKVKPIIMNGFSLFSYIGTWSCKKVSRVLVRLLMISLLWPTLVFWFD